MISYLEHGWYDDNNSDGKKNIRSELFDGAIDVAGFLYRGDVAWQQVERAALRIRRFVTLADPLKRGASTQFDDEKRDILIDQIEEITSPSPALHGFLLDCMEHIKQNNELFLLYLHLVHISRMMQLLDATSPSSSPSSPF